MKRLSIKMRVTLWYALLMLALVVVVLALVSVVGDYVATSGTKDALIAAVEDNMDEVEYDDGELEIDDDFAGLKNGVSSIVYTQDGELVVGSIPSGFETDLPLEETTVRTVSANGRTYYIYDREITFKKHDSLWIRGIVLASDSAGLANAAMKSAFIVLPFLLLVAVLGGYLITKKAFAPFDTISSAANAISEGSDLSGRIEIGSGKDEIHRLAETFNRMFARLETSFEQERQFTSDVSHELRTPVSVITAQCEYTLEYGENTQDYREALATVQRQTHRMHALISQMLEYTRLERGTYTIHREKIDISELVQLLCEERSLAPEKGIALTCEVSPNVVGEVDVMLLERLLTNLLNNAYQYGRENGTIRVQLRAQQGMAMLSVSDDGIGIAQEDIPKIWNRFYQADASRTANTAGSTGLGLSMVQQIVKLHGGTVWVESEPDKGSTFTVCIPI